MSPNCRIADTVVKIALTHPDAVMPKYAHVGDSGFDIYTVERTIIYPHSRKVLMTGLKMEIAMGYECQIRPRSGVSAKTNITVIEGTIDSGYRGHVGIIAHNTGEYMITIEKGERIAQGVINKIPCVLLVQCEEDELSTTTRGDNGFGSTGVSGEHTTDQSSKS